MSKPETTKEPFKSGVKRRGFASLSPERLKEIAALGGRSVPSEKRSFKNKTLAAAAGSRGGKNMPKERRSFAANPELAREASRISALARGAAARRKKANKSEEPAT